METKYQKFSWGPTFGQRKGSPLFRFVLENIPDVYLPEHMRN